MDARIATRPTLAIGAAALAAAATLITGLDGEEDFVPFFVGLTLAGVIGAWAVREPYVGRRRLIGEVIGAGWLGVAAIIGGALLWYQSLCACSFPTPPPEATYLGLTATAHRLVAVFIGGALMAVAAFSRALGSYRGAA